MTISSYFTMEAVFDWQAIFFWFVNRIFCCSGFGIAHTGRRPLRRLVRGRIGSIPSPVNGSSTQIDVAKVQGRVQSSRGMGLQQRWNLCSGTGSNKSQIPRWNYQRNYKGLLYVKDQLWMLNFKKFHLIFRLLLISWLEPFVFSRWLNYPTRN